MIKLIKSSFYNEKSTKKALTQFITSADILSFSEQCMLFEKNFSKYQETLRTVFVNSGSSANLALIQALLNLGRLKKGDKVGYSAITWSTNVMPIIQLGLEPVAIDIELDTLNVSSKKLQDVLKEHNISAVFLTNLLGFCDDIDAIEQICNDQDIILIEDNCESLGTVYHGKKLGNYGIASTFSFYVGHHMSTIEGGAVCTNDEELATMLQLVRAHGWDRNLVEHQQSKIREQYKVNSSFYSRYTFYDLGYNLRPTEINGFLGNLQLQYIDEIIQKRVQNFETLAKSLYTNPNYFPVRYNHLDVVSNFAVPIVCRSVALKDELVKRCADKVEIRPIVGGDMTQQPFYTKYYPHNDPQKTANAKLIHSQGLYFGNNPELTEDELQQLIEIFH